MHSGPNLDFNEQRLKKYVWKCGNQRLKTEQQFSLVYVMWRQVSARGVIVVMECLAFL